MRADSMLVYTIGHGRHSFDYFLSLLRQHEIAFLCDVRSLARSRWPQFNGRVLAESLQAHGIGYEHLPECGGKTLAPPRELERGLERIMEIAAEMRVCLMCSESQPVLPRVRGASIAHCHRVGLLAAPLRARGVRLLHILPDGESVEIDESKLASIW